MAAQPLVTEKHAVVVSRQWPSTTIAIDITTEGIGIQMSLEDFLTAVLLEMGSPATTFTRTQLAAKLGSAVDVVVAGMKQATAGVV